MSVTITPTEVQAVAALRAWLLKVVVPVGSPVVRGQVNRTPEPAASDFIVMWPVLRTRLATNVEEWTDTIVQGQIDGTTLTVTDVTKGVLAVGSPVYGDNVATGTTVVELGTGTGGLGTYEVTPEQIVNSEPMFAGRMLAQMDTELVVQLDVHGPRSGDNAQIIATLLRSDYACQSLSGTGVTPLYSGEPREMPFFNDQSQVEWRWVVEAHLQVNPIVAVPQEFFDTATAGIISVDATYPP